MACALCFPLAHYLPDFVVDRGGRKLEKRVIDAIIIFNQRCYGLFALRAVSLKPESRPVVVTRAMVVSYRCSATAIWSTSGIGQENHGGALLSESEGFFHLLGRGSQITEQYGVMLRPVGDASWIHLETNGN